MNEAEPYRYTYSKHLKKGKRKHKDSRLRKWIVNLTMKASDGR